MRLSLALAMSFAFTAFAGEQASSSAGKTKPTEGLVAAAKEAKGKRKTPSTKVITNADVRKSKGKLIELSPDKSGAATTTEPPVSDTKTLAQQDIDYRQRREHSEKTAAAQKVVTDLEKELEQLELRYYEENNPDRRDHVIRKRFEEKQKELESAQAALALLLPAPSEVPQAENRTP